MVVGLLVTVMPKTGQAETYSISVKNYAISLDSNNYPAALGNYGILVQGVNCHDLLGTGMCDSFTQEGTYTATAISLVMNSKEIIVNNQGPCVGCDSNAFGLGVLSYPNDFWPQTQTQARAVSIELAAGASIIANSKNLDEQTPIALPTNSTSGLWAYSGVTPPTQGMYQLQDEFALTNATPGGALNLVVNGLVSVSGPGANGVLGQSIGGGRSLTGSIEQTDRYVGDLQGAGGHGGLVTHTSSGAKVTAKGDGATGIMLQSVGGGGGSGANSQALFYAVGGKGGQGGAGGAVKVALTNTTIVSEGDFARGLIGQSIGGGGGHGGYAKAFGVLVDSGIGGKGGDGGDAGAVSLTTTNTNVTTTGQHAMGLVLQTIGGGGGIGGADQDAVAGVGFTVNVGVGGTGGSGGAGGDLNLTLDEQSTIKTTGLDAHGVLLQAISGGGGAGGAASGATYNLSDMSDVPVKVNLDIAIGGVGGSSLAPGKITVSNAGTIETAGAGSFGLVLQSIGGGGGHGADSTAGSNSWGDGGQNPEVAMNVSASVGGRGGAAGDGDSIELNSSGSITTSGHNAVGLLAHSIGGGGGVGGTGNAYDTKRWVGENETEEKSTYKYTIGSSVADGGSGGSAGDGGSINVTLTPGKGSGFTTLGAGAVGVIHQSIGGGGGWVGSAGTQSLGGASVNTEIGGAGGDGGSGGEVNVSFVGNVQTGRVLQLQYTDDDGQSKLSTPVAIGASSHGLVAQSIGGGGGMGGNADASTSLVPELSSLISDGKVLNIKDGIEYWTKKVVDDKSPEFDVEYTGTLSVGGSGGKGGHGGNMTVNVPGRSDITTYGHHAFAIMAQSVGGGGGAAGSATSHSVVSADVALKKLGSDADVGLTLSLGGSGGVSGDGGDVALRITNPLNKNYQVPNNSNPGNYLRTGGYASHVVFAQSIGGGGGVAHEGSVLGLASVQGWDTPKATLGHVSTGGAVLAGDGGNVSVGDKNKPVVGWIESAGDVSSLIFGQSIGGGGGTASFGCASNGRKGNSLIRHSPCFTDASAVSDVLDLSAFSAGKFINTEQRFDMAISANGGVGGDVQLYVGDSHLTTDGDRAIAIVAQSIGGGGGYISADARNVGAISQTVSTVQSSRGGEINVTLEGGTGGEGTAYVSTYGAGAWGILAQSIGGGGGLLGDTSLDILGVPHVVTNTPNLCSSDVCRSEQVSVTLKDAILKTFGTNSHGIVVQSWSGGGGIFGGSDQSSTAPLVLGTIESGAVSTARVGSDQGVFLFTSIDEKSTVSTSGKGSIAILMQTNILSATSPIQLLNSGDVIGGATYTNAEANNRLVQGIGVMISGGSDVGPNYLANAGNLSTVGGVSSGYAIMTDYGVTNVDNFGTITGSVDLGSNPGTFNNQSGGVLNKGAVYKVGNNSLHNRGTINIGEEGSAGTTNLEGRIVQYDSGRMLVTFDVLGEQTNDRLIVDGTAAMGGSFEPLAKSLLPGSYEFLTATNLTVTADAVDRLLYAWDAKVDSESISVAPTRTFRAEGLSLSPTSQNLVSYLERAWDNGDDHHAELFGYKHELDAIEGYNTLLEGLSGQALNAQPLQMRILVLSNLGDSMDCPTSTPTGLRLGEDRCVWAKLTGEVSDLSPSDHNIGYNSTGGGLRVGAQHTLGQGWTVGATAGYALNGLTATNFSSDGQVFDLSLSAKREVGQWSVGGSLGYARGWFDNSRRVSAADAGIASGYSQQYNSNSRLSVYSAKLRLAYTFEQKQHYIRPYLDVDVAHSQAPGFSETGEGKLALKTQPSNQWGVGISPMVEYGADFVRKDKTRMKFFVSAGANFLPNNQQTTPTSFVGAQAANGTFDVITDGPNVLGRLNLGLHIYEQAGYEVRAQYGLQAGQNYWSQSVSINAMFRF